MDNKNVKIETIIAYIDALKLALKDGTLASKELRDAVSNMPSSSYIKSNMSDGDCLVLFDIVRWAWKEATGSDIVNDSEVSTKETLMGNYWMLNNGVLLQGTNHYSIIKQNINVFCLLLNINPMVIHSKLSTTPNEVIKTVIDNGGMRMFITKDGRAYFQINDTAYTEWGRDKIKGLDFKNRIVKLISLETKFTGWDSGITVII